MDVSLRKARAASNCSRGAGQICGALRGEISIEEVSGILIVGGEVRTVSFTGTRFRAGSCSQHCCTKHGPNSRCWCRSG